MGTHTGNSRLETARHHLDEQYSALKSGMHRIVKRVMTHPDGSPSRFSVWSKQATEAVKAHPYLAVGIALGAGYLIMRLVRR